MQKALKSCQKSNKLPDLVTLACVMKIYVDICEWSKVPNFWGKQTIQAEFVHLIKFTKVTSVIKLIFSSFHHLQDAFSRFRFNLRWFLILDDGSSQINAQVFARGWNLYQCCKNNWNLWLTWLPDNFKFLLPNSKIS